MAQIPKGRLVKGPYKPICRDCAMYFSTTVGVFKQEMEAVWVAKTLCLATMVGERTVSTLLLHHSRGGATTQE